VPDVSDEAPPGPEPVCDPGYWHDRIALAAAHAAPPFLWPHTSVFCCTPDVWERIAQRHAALLAVIIGPEAGVLDAGCGWGRLLDLMPHGWYGAYCGVDVAPAFVALASSRHPSRRFLVADLRKRTTWPDGAWDWAVVVSMRGMLRRNVPGAWEQVEAELRRVARRVLVLEYDVDDGGDIL
jgi:hypothetical protein